MNHRLLFLLLALTPCAAGAQGVSTSGIRGHVRAEAEVPPARVSVKHDATGFSITVPASAGRFLVQGLEPGGPYTIRITAIGFTPHELKGVVLQLGELRDIEVVLRRSGVVLDTITVTGAPQGSAESSGGTGMRIRQDMLERLPTLNRDFYDFVRLVPQISTKISLANPGLSAGGVGFRFNNFFINGVSDRTLSGGVSNTFGGVRTIPLDAVREYQVLLSPYDVRYGDFAGAMINAVTRSGTNDMRGSGFIYARNDNIARNNESGPYERVQYGLTIGGPVVRDRVHFFISGELQHLKYPAAGPFVGQSPDARDPVPVSNADLERFISLMNRYGMSAGSGGQIQNSNPLRNLFAQTDVALARWNSRATIWGNFSESDDRAFSRAAALRDTFSLSSAVVTRSAGSRSAALRLHTVVARGGGANNELLIARRADHSSPESDFRQPVVRVLTPTVSGGRITLNAGTQEFAQDTWVRARSTTVKDNFTLQLANHLLTLGGELESFLIRRSGAPGSFGQWNFASLNDFDLGLVDRYDLRLDFGTASTPLSGRQYAMYAGDQWNITSRLSITAGIRADRLSFADHAPYQRGVDSVFGRRTDTPPDARIELSPRAGFVWHLSANQKVRGGMGLFTARFPLGWMQTTLSSYGVGGTLICTRGGSAFFSPPAFNPDRTKAPTACGGGFAITPSSPGDVDLLASNLKMMRVLRGSLAYDVELPRGIGMSNELMGTRALTDFVFVNLNLPDPLGTDLQGRVMYGALTPLGTLPTPIRRRSEYSEVIDVQNTDRNWSYQFATRLEKRPSSGIGGSISYTFSRVRDVQTPTRVNTSGRTAWAAARVVSGRHDKLDLSISSNDIPHRVVLQGVYGRPWSAGRTEFAFYYIGESGRPFTYVAFGALPGRGDLNADRSNTNDPIYVPKNAFDTTEMRFSGISDSTGADNSSATQTLRIAAEAKAFETFIENEKCMRQQRGKILARNTCREPWSNTTLGSVTHQFNVLRQSFEVQIEAFNLFNLVSKDLGLKREAIPQLLEHVGQTIGSAETSRPIFRFNTATARWTTLPVESAFQLQLALRYRF